jgi:hypothetical protein
LFVKSREAHPERLVFVVTIGVQAFDYGISCHFGFQFPDCGIPKRIEIRRSFRACHDLFRIITDAENPDGECRGLIPGVDRLGQVSGDVHGLAQSPHGSQAEAE